MRLRSSAKNWGQKKTNGNQRWRNRERKDEQEGRLKGLVFLDENKLVIIVTLLLLEVHSSLRDRTHTWPPFCQSANEGLESV